MASVSPYVLLLVGIVLGLASGLGLGYTLAVLRTTSARVSWRDEVASLRSDAAAWQARAEELEERAQLAEERNDRDGSVLRALAPVRSQLEQVGAKVEQMERSRAKQHATLTEQLRTAALAEKELSRTTANLEGALRSRSARGLWGEVELARILEASGMLPHIDFSEQKRIGALRKDAEAARPDAIIHLPGGAHLALDAKVPLDSYLKACTQADQGGAAEEQRLQLLQAHAKALRSHVDALAARHYERALPSSPELVVLFVPAEPVLAAALEADPTLLEHALGLGVALTSPASLLALLRTCATAWARTAVNDDAAALLELGRTLYERLAVVARHADQLGMALQRSVQAYNRMAGSMESRLLVTARSFTALAQDLPELREVSPDAAQLRQFSAPELSQSQAPQA
ncbi:DNA recombination protein rmuC [Actinomyces bovis]|uniref:DNA recombination protein rmuC n=1 Tax=Actinomyces bovis TaxID=1658 RepID=A0ABY1VNA4_9ACTO|nr:DNA recombination protein RmuC [Actinomyces bovis]SPT53177.1 DNA recombination protein rmuC [Actinomyces bovis]VEG52383.1 DNA recombination protein rmuC [Actinomyces israelii]